MKVCACSALHSQGKETRSKRKLQNFEIFATFFAAAKVDVELASFALFRPAMQLGNSMKVRACSGLHSQRKETRSKRKLKISKFLQLFSLPQKLMSSSLLLLCYALFRPAMQLGHLNEGVRMPHLCIRCERKRARNASCKISKFSQLFSRPQNLMSSSLLLLNFDLQCS